MKTTRKNNLKKLGGGLAAAIFLVSCEGGYIPSDEYTVIKAPKGKSKDQQEKQTLRPTVKFPARMAIAKVKSGHEGELLFASNQQIERPEYRQTIQHLNGLAGVVNVNNTIATRGETSFEDLRDSARSLGSNMLGVYRLNTTTRSKEAPAIFQLATLGLAPINGHRSVSSASLMLMDAKTGYLYGVLEESGSKKRLSSLWGIFSVEFIADNSNELEAEQIAMDKLMKKVPAFWRRTYEKHAK